MDDTLYKFRIETGKYTNKEDVKALSEIIHSTLGRLHTEAGIPYLPQTSRKNDRAVFDFVTTLPFTEKLGQALEKGNLSQQIEHDTSGEFSSYAIRLTAADGPHHKEVPQNALRFLKKEGALLGRKITTVSVDSETFNQLTFQALPKDAHKLNQMLQKTTPPEAIVVDSMNRPLASKGKQNGKQPMACVVA
ncbi:MAG: hypothetical protein AB7S81_04735 [Bdellovibrionales bacterium]